MQYIDATIGTTVASTTVGGDTGMISLPGDCSLVGYVPATTMYLQGGNSIAEVVVTKYTTRSVRINKLSVKYNVLKLHYTGVGSVVRT